MALDRFGAEVFLLLKKFGVPMRKVLTFGRQHFSVHPGEVDDVPGLSEIIAQSPELSDGGEHYADPFFKNLGAESVLSLDASHYESCSQVHDLNQPIPEDWHASYDVVFDGGTLEHVFHFPNAIANAMNFLKPGGVLITQSPSNNLNGHGFYQFSPELFFRLFDQANGFQILLMAFVESEEGSRWYQIDDPNKIGRRVTFGGDGPLQLIMVARRETVEEPLVTYPQQSDYSASWAKAEAPVDQNSGEVPDQPSRKSLKGFLRRILPAKWVTGYERCRVKMRHRKAMLEGVTEIDSPEACFDKKMFP